MIFMEKSMVSFPLNQAIEVTPPKKKRKKSLQLQVTAVLEALVCIFLALNWVFSCSSWKKTAGKPLEIRKGLLN